MSGDCDKDEDVADEPGDVGHGVHEDRHEQLVQGYGGNIAQLVLIVLIVTVLSIHIYSIFLLLRRPPFSGGEVRADLEMSCKRTFIKTLIIALIDFQCKIF